jgi:hypothetical protein
VTKQRLAMSRPCDVESGGICGITGLFERSRGSNPKVAVVDGRPTTKGFRFVYIARLFGRSGVSAHGGLMKPGRWKPANTLRVCSFCGGEGKSVRNQSSGGGLFTHAFHNARASQGSGGLKLGKARYASTKISSRGRRRGTNAKVGEYPQEDQT